MIIIYHLSDISIGIDNFNKYYLSKYNILILLKYYLHGYIKHFYKLYVCNVLVMTYEVNNT